MESSSPRGVPKTSDAVAQRIATTILNKLRANPGALDNCRELQIICRLDGTKIDVALKTTH
jgi:hypothetical protein